MPVLSGRWFESQQAESYDLLWIWRLHYWLLCHLHDQDHCHQLTRLIMMTLKKGGWLRLVLKNEDRKIKNIVDSTVYILFKREFVSVLSS